MRIARWRVPGGIQAGFVIGDEVVSFGGDETIEELIAAGLESARQLEAEALDRHRAGARVDDGRQHRIGDVTLLAPYAPPTVRDFVTFESHVEGVTASVDGASNIAPEWYEAPTFYFTNPRTIIGPADAVQPPRTDRLDFELELAAILGGPAIGEGADLSVDQARASIFGYTVMNDWSARDIQAREMKVHLGPAKGKDFATTIGPWIVTADELAAHLDEDGFLHLVGEALINGRLVGRDSFANMGWSFAEMIAYASRNSRVGAGDLLGSGTIGHGGCLAELWGRSGALDPRPLQEGDEVTLRIEGVGTLTSTIGAVRGAVEVPRARRRL